jgi:uncharacterized protein
MATRMKSKQARSLASGKTDAARLYRKALRLAKMQSPDFPKIANMLRDAGKLGSGEATYALATWYLHGEYFDKDLKKGTRLLRVSAKQKVPAACYDLAVSYEMGIVVKKDPERAFQLYMEAAMRGDNASNREVARCLWHGIGTSKNRVLADLWGAKHKA